MFCSATHSICRCDDIDNDVPRGIETSNGKIEFHNAMIMIMLLIEICQ